MRPEDREPLYWALSEIAERAPRDDTLVPDSTLAAYRAGALDEKQAREVERLLVRNPANRRRLEELAEAVPTAAPGGVRRGVIGAVGDSAARLPDRRRRWRRVLAIAAVVALVLTVSWQTVNWRTGKPHQGPPVYQARIAALAERRDLATPALAAEAYADSTVTITATVTEPAVSGVEVGLYRAVGERLERLAIGDGSAIEGRPGAVRFVAPAADLVGPEPGLYEILVAIAWQDRLPTTVAVKPGDDPVAALAAAGVGQVHRLTLRLLAESSAIPINAEPFSGRRTSDEEIAYVSYLVGSPIHLHSLGAERPGLQAELDALQESL